ncbi:MoxR family ATPase [Amycolatopsis sp. Hca4]|uniref:AAA family ATPase n=1 Tax=Amycolatopsis sp. Hca4 TaxID=2742131 RepID=UPI001591A619|nr:AAA family ATPase [Amycolatopsis sp. Hca4]QKV78423.1 AAA family ATPase [Amycolatopsis sp. Hca4]
MNRTELADRTPDWWIYRGTGQPLQDMHLSDRLPPPPPWRDFRRDGEPLAADVPQDDAEIDRRLGVALSFTTGQADRTEVDMVNAALYLRRPLLVTGKPGSGKSSLAYRISRELRLGRVLRWSVTSQTTLKSGLYDYDAIGRVQASAARHAGPGEPGGEEPPIGDFVRLRELGTAFLPCRLPRVLLVDELDKAESDLPHDLLSIFEDGEFLIPELARDARRSPVAEVFTADPGYTAQVENGVVRCSAFPVVVITSNGERDFPPAFLRRCLRLEMKDPDPAQLAAIVAAHALDPRQRGVLIEDFVARRAALGGLPADKLLDAIFLATSGAYHPDDPGWPALVESLWQHLNQQGH